MAEECNEDEREEEFCIFFGYDASDACCSRCLVGAIFFVDQVKSPTTEIVISECKLQKSVILLRRIRTEVSFDVKKAFVFKLCANLNMIFHDNIASIVESPLYLMIKTKDPYDHDHDFGQ